MKMLVCQRMTFDCIQRKYYRHIIFQISNISKIICSICFIRERVVFNNYSLILSIAGHIFIYRYNYILVLYEIRVYLK